MTDHAPAQPEDFAKDLRGFGVLGLVAILAILSGNFLFRPLSALLVLLWAAVSHTPWRELGFVRPKNWARTLVVGLLFGVAFKFFMKAVVMPLLGANPVNQTYHFLAGNRAALPQMIYLLIFIAGFGEEAFYRGWMFERLGKLFGENLWAKTLTIFLTAILFGLSHLADQGVPGAEQAIITGLVFGTIFAMTGRLWLPMIAHAAFDLAALWMIYYNVETSVAHLIFR